MRHRPQLHMLTLGLVLFLAASGVRAGEISSYAFVHKDGTLTVDGYRIRLFGIYIPPTEESCLMFERPIQCGPRAALALDFKIGSNFVHCEPKHDNADGSITALCRVDGEDLSAYLLKYGWALALSDAPFAYKALEEIARQRGIGVWGLPVTRTRLPARPRHR